MNAAREDRRTAVRVEALDGYVIDVIYADGVEVEYRLSHLMDQGVFRRLQPRSVFESIRIGAGGRSVGWVDPEGRIEPLIDIGADTIRRKGHQVAGPKPPEEADSVFWKGDVPENFDLDDWLSSVIEALAEAVAEIGEVELGAQSIFIHGDELELRIDVWPAPYPSPPGVEARVTWELVAGEETVNGETDVQPDDSMTYAREHVLGEVNWGISYVGKRR